MIYPFMTLNDETEIVHSESKMIDGREMVKVVIEKPVWGGFHSAVCWLPDFEWKNVQGFTPEEMQYYQKVIEENAKLILARGKNHFQEKL